MSVTSCTLSRTGRTGRFYVDGRGGIAGDLAVEWNVVTDANTDGVETVYTEAQTSSPDALPALYATYSIGGESDPGLFLLNVAATQSSEKLTEWKVRGDYRSLPFGVTAEDANVDPLLRPWKYQLQFDTISEIITEGWNIDPLTSFDGTQRAALTRGPITNTAGQEFETVVEEPRTRIILVGIKNFAILDEIYAISIAYADSLNSVPFNSYPAEHCEFLGASSSDLINESGTEYYQGIVRIALNHKPVRLSPVNSGWKAWNVGPVLENVTDDKNRPVSEPKILTATGTDPDKNVSGGGAKQEKVEYSTRENLKNYNLIFTSQNPVVR